MRTLAFFLPLKGLGFPRIFCARLSEKSLGRVWSVSLVVQRGKGGDKAIESFGQFHTCAQEKVVGNAESPLVMSCREG
jgi:hypothetical protein